MKKLVRHQKLPPTGPERELLREKGQFWTPQWVAEAMVAYVLGGGSSELFDPAVGGGAFFKAAKSTPLGKGVPISLRGTEIDCDSLRGAAEAGLSPEDLNGVEIRDFVLNPPRRHFSAIVANPPYIRHHRISDKVKGELKILGKTIVGRPLDGRAGYHIYFLIRALSLLAKGGRLAFIMPADTCEGIFAPTLWKWITRKYRLDAVVRFAAEATPFPDVDTNALIFMISHAEPTDSFCWCTCSEPGTSVLKRWVESGFKLVEPGIETILRDLKEALETGFSRPEQEKKHEGLRLGDFAYVMRGIATGGNDFFFLTHKQARLLSLPEKWLVEAIGRTRDVRGDEITEEDLSNLEKANRPTLLLSLDGRAKEEFPAAVQRYLAYGEQRLGIPKRVLVAQRKPWYKMEVRRVPPFLFAYLGRRNARFIRNRANVVPLTGFLCVYSRRNESEYVETLWGILRHPDTVANLQLVGKSYGSGAIKVEPRALERLPIPESAAVNADMLGRYRGVQPEISFSGSMNVTNAWNGR